MTDTPGPVTPRMPPQHCQCGRELPCYNHRPVTPRTEAGRRLWKALGRYPLEGPGGMWIHAITEVEREAAAPTDHEYDEREDVTIEREAAEPTPDRCDRIVNNGMGEPTECGRTLPCNLHSEPADKETS